jgi:hypothetical protein
MRAQNREGGALGWKPIGGDGTDVDVRVRMQTIDTFGLSPSGGASISRHGRSRSLPASFDGLRQPFHAHHNHQSARTDFDGFQFLVGDQLIRLCEPDPQGACRLGNAAKQLFH